LVKTPLGMSFLRVRVKPKRREKNDDMHARVKSRRASVKPFDQGMSMAPAREILIFALNLSNVST